MNKLASLTLACFAMLALMPSANAAFITGGVFGDRSYGGGATLNRGLGLNTRRGAQRSRYASRGSRSGRTYRTSSRYSGGVGPRPRKWCGWWMRKQKGGGPEFNVAWNWRKYGRPTSPQIGAVVVWRHHVAMITGRTADGRWITTGGNESGRVRTRARSLKGAIFRI